MCDGEDKILIRSVACKIACDHAYVEKELKKVNMKRRKKIKAPKYTDIQIETVKTQYNFMYRNFGKWCFILDDEKYFTLSGSQMPGNNIYYTSN